MSQWISVVHAVDGSCLQLLYRLCWLEGRSCLQASPSLEAPSG